jgi:hypothetical protein
MKRIWTLAFSLLASTLVFSQDKAFQYYVFPIQGITGISRPPGIVKVEGPKYGGMIDAKYADEFFPDSAQQQLNSFFQAEVQSKFPKSTVSAKQVLGTKSNAPYQYVANAQCSDKGFAVDYGDSYAIALGINRLSVYVNQWDKYADILIPVTYNIRFVQMSTGESAFTQSETIYTRYSGLSANVLDPNTKQISKAVLNVLSNAIRDDAKKITTSLIEKAAKSFNPQKTTITVVGRDGKYIIFGNGSEVGFSSNQSFDATNDKNQDLMYDIVYATKGLAVGIVSKFSPEVTRASDAVSKDDKLSFVFSQQGKDDAKPTVLVNQFLASYMPNKSLTAQQVLNNSLSSILADNIGFDAPFNIIKHDPDNVLLLNQIKSEANCDSGIYEKIPGFAANTNNSRPTPDFFLKLESFNSPAYTAWGVGRVNSNTSFNTSVGLSLIDKSGVVRQAFLGTSPYELSRSVGKGLSLQDAVEVNLKNATLSAVGEFKSKFKFKNSVIPIKSVGSGAITLAQPLPVSIFDDARIVHPVSHAGKTVLIPISSSVAKLVHPPADSDRIEFKGQISSSDLIQVPSLDYSKKPAVKCEGKIGRTLQGNLNVPSGADITITPVGLYGAKGFSLMEADSVFLTSIKSVLQDARFAEGNIFEPQPAAACYLAMEFQGITKNECTSGKCSGAATVASGLRIFVNENKVAESIATSKFEFSDIDSELLPNFIGLKTYENHVQNYLNHQTKLFTKE